MTQPSQWRPSDWLLANAAARMHAKRPHWTHAMLAEADHCTSPRDRLAWAWGCWVASLRTSSIPGVLLYAASLLAGLAGMAAYEWSADESRATIALLGVVALILGAIRPPQAWLSGTLTGLVVAAVIGFEALSGIRPAYEIRAQTISGCLLWAGLLVPAMLAASAGAKLGRLLQAAKPAL